MGELEEEVYEPEIGAYDDIHECDGIDECLANARIESSEAMLENGVDALEGVSIFRPWCGQIRSL